METSASVKQWFSSEQTLKDRNIDILITTHVSLNYEFNNFLPQERRGVGILHRVDVNVRDVIKHFSGRIIISKYGEVVIIGVYAKTGAQYMKQRHDEFLFHLAQLVQQYQHVPFLIIGDFNIFLHKRESKQCAEFVNTYQLVDI